MFRISLGAEFNKEIKRAIMEKKFPRMDENDMQNMIDAMEAQEDKTAQGISGSIVNRIPSLRNLAAINANSSGKNGGDNGKSGFFGNAS
jgi:hypothetical protein